MITELLETRISAALARAGAPADSPALVGPATRPEFGDYQANGVMAAAKKLKTNPRALAAQVVEELDLEDMAASVDIAGPGFINIQLKGEWLAAQLGNVLADPRLGVPKAAPQKVVIDYSHPNLAKEMHIGHLRSTVIGDAIARVLEFSGHEVVRHNHVGDWGTQFGMLIAHLDQLADPATELADLEVFYQSARQRFDQDAAFADLSREYVVKLQGGDPHVLRMWQQFIDESLAHGQRVYAALGVGLEPEDVRGESAYNDDLPRVVEDLRAKGLLVESNGAQCVFLEEFKNKDGQITPVIVQKSDGGYLYATSDLAAVRYRAGALAADRILYIVDARQSLHLQQVFRGGAGGWVRARDDRFGAPCFWRDSRRGQSAIQDASRRHGQADGCVGGRRGAGLCPSEREKPRNGRGRAAADRPRGWHWQRQVHGAVVQPHLGLRVRLGQDAGPRRQHRSVHALFVCPHQEHVPPRRCG